MDRTKPIFLFVFKWNVNNFVDEKKIFEASDLIDKEEKKFLFIVANLKHAASR